MHHSMDGVKPPSILDSSCNNLLLLEGPLAVHWGNIPRRSFTEICHRDASKTQTLAYTKQLQGRIGVGTVFVPRNT